MSDTPRTDALVAKLDECHRTRLTFVIKQLVSHAKQLERELAATVPQMFVTTFPNGEKPCDCDPLSEVCKLGRKRTLQTAEFTRCLIASAAISNKPEILGAKSPNAQSGAWTCNRCGFIGFWEGGPHDCENAMTAVHLAQDDGHAVWKDSHRDADNKCGNKDCWCNTSPVAGEVKG